MAGGTGLKGFIAAGMALALAGCAYQVANDAPEAPAPYLAYTNRVPGKWLLLVDARAATAQPAIVEARCNQFDYAMDFTKSFQQSAIAAFGKAADEVRFSDHPLNRAEFAADGYTGVIRLNVTAFRPRAKVEGFMDATADAVTEINGTISVVKGGQAMVDESQSGIGKGTRETGPICGGTADAMSDATIAAMQDLVRKMAEDFANSRTIRFSVPSYTPQ